jgi:phosphoglycerol transferase MdoB-like AlkP superfamily enzyme
MAQEFHFSDIFAVLYHGLPIDLSVSGYLTLIPALLLIVSIWVRPKAIRICFDIYYAIALLLVSVIAVVDIIIYPYWGFHFDASVFLYLKKPGEAMASASVVEIIAGLLAVTVSSVLFCFGYGFLMTKKIRQFTKPRLPFVSCLVLMLMTALLFFPVRGGVTASTMNTGNAYFSDDMFLNHAAVNPQFNLLYSFTKSEDFASQYQFYDSEEAERIFNNLQHSSGNSSVKLLTSARPNIILFILESFSGNVFKSLGGEDVAVHLDSFAREDILFSNFYANSYRTDRGLVSILGGYPAHPTAAIIKYPWKTQSLPSIPKTLQQAGYGNMSFYYGGDVDFANIRSYIVGSCGICDICSDKNFPLSERSAKWGVHDESVINKVYTDLTETQQEEPFLKIVLTLSSHEPFDVPVKKYGEPFLNSVAYTDSCVGNFLCKLKKTDLWENTLVILLPDHAMQSYPGGVSNYDPLHFHIPMIWTGGAVGERRTITDFGSQNDLAATLLAQLGVNHDSFCFSKNMLDAETYKFGFYAYNNGFSIADSTGRIIFDNNKNALITAPNDRLEKSAKAFFQTMYLDLGNR